MNELFEKVHCRIDSSTFPKKWPVQSKSICIFFLNLAGKNLLGKRVVNLLCKGGFSIANLHITSPELLEGRIWIVQNFVHQHTIHNASGEKWDCRKADCTN
jgi:hypothetical protein